ncbi:MAG: hydantoinase B/oxoprolinase family protein, partial [Phycisphaerae bacterium]
ALEPLSLSLLSQRRVRAPYGLHGGEDGQPGRHLLLRANETLPTAIGGSAQVELDVGDRFIVETPGGGGWGDPHRREGC